MAPTRKWSERLCFAHQRTSGGTLMYQCTAPVSYHCVLQGEDVYLCEAHYVEFVERNRAEGMPFVDLFERIPTHT